MVTLTTSLAFYLLSPLFSGREVAFIREIYGSYADVLVNTAAAILLSNLLLLPILLILVGSQPFESGVRLNLGDVHPTPPLLSWALVTLDFSLLLVVALRTLQPGMLRWSDLGLTQLGKVGTIVSAGLAGGFALLTISAVLQSALAGFGISPNPFPTLPLTAKREELLPLLLGTVILAPIAEEVFFRGYVFRAHLVRKRRWQAYGLSALLFALLHLEWTTFLPIFAMGLVLAFLYQRTGSLLPCIVAHSVNNATAMAGFYFLATS